MNVQHFFRVPTPASDAVIQRDVIPATQSRLPSLPWSPEALVMLLAIGRQESGFRTRLQSNGPARGFWQMEQGGGVHGVMTHHASADLSSRLLTQRGIAADERSAWTALAADDVLACGFARLLLYTDKRPLPALGDEDGAWTIYNSVWRPGKPRPGDWVGSYAAALSAIKGKES